MADSQVAMPSDAFRWVPDARLRPPCAGGLDAHPNWSQRCLPRPRDYPPWAPPPLAHPEYPGVKSNSSTVSSRRPRRRAAPPRRVCQASFPRDFGEADFRVRGLVTRGKYLTVTPPTWQPARSSGARPPSASASGPGASSSSPEASLAGRSSTTPPRSADTSGARSSLRSSSAASLTVPPLTPPPTRPHMTNGLSSRYRILG